MSKKINTDDIANELAAGSLFFGKNARPVSPDSDETGDTTTPRSFKVLWRLVVSVLALLLARLIAHLLAHVLATLIAS